MAVKYYCVKQQDITDCGAACIATVARQYDLSIPVTAIREIAGTDRDGTTAYGLIKAAGKLGFDAKGVRAEEHELTDDLLLPAIAHVRKDNYEHFVVIHAISDSAMVIADPEIGVVTQRRQEFLAQWSGVLLLLLPVDRRDDQAVESRGSNRFLSLLKPFRKVIGEILLASFLFTLLGLLSAFYFSYLIDEVFVNGLKHSLNVVSIGVVILTIFKVSLDGFRKHLLVYLSQRIDLQMVFSYYRHILRLPMSFFESRRVGEILSRINDGSKIQEALSGGAVSIALDSAMVIGAGTVLFLQSRTLFWIAAAIMPLGAMLVWIFIKPFQEKQRLAMQQAAKTESQLVESLSGIDTIKALNAEAQAIEQTEECVTATYRTTFSLAKMENIQTSLQELIHITGGIAILWIGGMFVINGAISIGTLITFYALLAYFHKPIQNLLNLQPKIQEAVIAAQRLEEIFSLPVEKSGGISQVEDHIGKSIEFDSVVFRYGSREKILDGLSLDISGGEKIGIIGESGGGKTTLVKLLMKYYPVEAGAIRIGGIDIRDLDTSTLRGAIGYVPQNITLFSGTIAENISLGHEGVPFEKILEAAERSSSLAFINSLPLRFQTMIGERGMSLSGGQRQRIAIARAILHDPKLLILDEATSNLDTITESAIHRTIESLSVGRTTIIIAHRLSTLAMCDRVIVMDSGAIIEQGSHSELLAQRGFYSRLWDRQRPVSEAV
jgi:ABC-type bacteriocin transporter